MPDRSEVGSDVDASGIIGWMRLSVESFSTAAPRLYLVPASIRHPLIHPGEVEARAYQLEAVDSALQRSTLLVMPTAMGKTAVEWMTLAEVRRRSPEGMVVLVAPTNGLVDQHLRDLRRVLTDTAGTIMSMTGRTAPAKRELMWEEQAIVVATPQVVRNDAVSGTLDLSKVSLLVVDEAHHATGSHAVAQLADMYRDLASSALVLGATASPGSTEEQIEEVCERLGIEGIHARRKDEPMLIEHASGLEVEDVPVPVPEALTELAEPLQKWLDAIVDRERRLGHYIRPGRVTVGGLQQAMERISAAIQRGERVAYSSAKQVASAIRINNVVNLLLSQGVAAARESLQRMQRAGSEKDGKAVRELLRDRRMRDLAKSLSDMDEIHSKVSFTRRIVRQEIRRVPGGRVIIFANYRDTVEALVEILQGLDGVRPKRFIGQASRDGRSGMTQKEQLARLKEFREGEVNVLVATSVGEEGLDVPSADLVVFYEPVGSEIRTIQRRGRTGRHRGGSVYVLVAIGTRDEGARAAAEAREARMSRALQRVRRRRSSSPHNDLAALSDFEVEDEIGVESALEFVQRERERCRVELKRSEKEQAGESESKAGSESVRSSIDAKRDRTSEEIESGAAGSPPPEKMRSPGQSGLDSFPQKEGSALSDSEDDIETGIGEAEEDWRALDRIMTMDTSLVDRERAILDAHAIDLLASLPDVGRIRADALMESFGSIVSIASASIDELQTVEGIGPATAASIQSVLTGERT